MSGGGIGRLGESLGQGILEAGPRITQGRHRLHRGRVIVILFTLIILTTGASTLTLKTQLPIPMPIIQMGRLTSRSTCTTSPLIIITQWGTTQPCISWSIMMATDITFTTAGTATMSIQRMINSRPPLGTL